MNSINLIKLTRQITNLTTVIKFVQLRLSKIHLLIVINYQIVLIVRKHLLKSVIAAKIHVKSNILKC